MVKLLTCTLRSRWRYRGRIWGQNCLCKTVFPSRGMTDAKPFIVCLFDVEQHRQGGTGRTDTTGPELTLEPPGRPPWPPASPSPSAVSTLPHHCARAMFASAHAHDGSSMPILSRAFPRGLRSTTVAALAALLSGILQNASQHRGGSGGHHPTRCHFFGLLPTTTTTTLGRTPYTMTCMRAEDHYSRLAIRTNPSRWRMSSPCVVTCQRRSTEVGRKARSWHPGRRRP